MQCVPRIHRWAPLQEDCTSMQKDNAISMPNDLAAVVAAWPSLSDDHKAQVLAIVGGRIA